MRTPGIGLTLMALMCFTLAVSAQDSFDPPAPALPEDILFGKGLPAAVEDLPLGLLRTGLTGLPDVPRGKAMNRLRGFTFPGADAVQSLQVDSGGGVFYICPAQNPAPDGPPPPPDSKFEAKSGPVLIADPPIYHSRPGAARVIFLDFNGSVVTGTWWNTDFNGGNDFIARPFDTDGDETTFSVEEQLDIWHLWQRVAEDYAPFDVDVTTEAPPGLPATWAVTVGHVLITPDYDDNGVENPYGTSSGGVAYVDVYDWVDYPQYRPAWVYYENLGEAEDTTAEAASHEMGHNLGLSHDGRGTPYNEAYYQGHGTGLISWGPIMGTGYDQNVSQWSKGEYFASNNAEDDLSIISAYLTYRLDDLGGNAMSAGFLNISAGTTIDPDDAANQGVIERTSDTDMLAFSTGAGSIELFVDPWISPGLTRGGNLDIKAELYNAVGTLVASADPGTDTRAQINVNVPEGVYYLLISGVGAGSPLSNPSSGYTEYGSLGQFFVSGTVQPVSGGDIIRPVAQVMAGDVLAAGGVDHTFTIVYRDDQGIDVSTISPALLRVTGPNGFDEPAVFQSVDIGTDGTPRTATYTVEAPGGAWGSEDLGTYVVVMGTDQVADVNGLYVADGPLGIFQCFFGIYYASMNSDPGWTLEGEWAYGFPAGGGGDPTGYAVLGYDITSEGLYGGQITHYAVSPVIDCSGYTSVDLSFLRYLGVERNDYARVELTTDGSSWDQIWSNNGQVVNDSSWALLSGDLSSLLANQPTVQMRLIMGPTTRNGHSFGWNVDEIIFEGMLDREGPRAALTAADITVAGGTDQSLTITYTDNLEVNVADLGDNDIFVTGPNGYNETAIFGSVDLPGNGTPRAAAYTIPSAGTEWGVEDNGVYTVYLQPGSVHDGIGNPAMDPFVGTFLVNINTEAPALSWTGETGYGADGLDPEEGDSRTVFTYRIIYTDADNSPPQWVRARVDRNGDGDYADTDESLNMYVDYATAIPSLADGSFVNGEVFMVTTTIACGMNTDNCSYYFETDDGDYGDTLTGANTPDVRLSLDEGPAGNTLTGEGNQNEAVYYSFTVVKGGAGTETIDLSYGHTGADWGTVVFYEDVNGNGAYDSGTDTSIGGNQISLDQGGSMNILAAITVPAEGEALDGEYHDTSITASFNPSSTLTVNTWVINPLAVSIAALKAEWAAEGILVSWVTGFESDNLGFNIYCREGSGDFTKVNAEILPASHNAISGAAYSYVFEHAVPGREYAIMVEDVDLYGNARMHGPVSVGDDSTKAGTGRGIIQIGNPAVPILSAPQADAVQTDQETGGCMPGASGLGLMWLFILILAYRRNISAASRAS